jgi:hypothetical protein
MCFVSVRVFHKLWKITFGMRRQFTCFCQSFQEKHIGEDITRKHLRMGGLFAVDFVYSDNTASEMKRSKELEE